MQNPPYISKCFLSFTLYFSTSPSLSSIISFTYVLHPPNFSIGSTSSWSPPKSFHVFSATLSHLVPARTFFIFSHTALSTIAGNIVFGIFFILYCHFIFLMSLIVLGGYIPSSALNTVFLVVVEHPSIFLAAAICTVSSCCANFAFPSHTSPAYSLL